MEAPSEVITNTPASAPEPSFSPQEVCLVCKGSKELKVMSTACSLGGDQGGDDAMDYFQIFQRTFYLDFPTSKNFRKYYQLCVDCVTLLNQSYEFKKSSEAAYEQLWTHIVDDSEWMTAPDQIIESEEVFSYNVNIEDGNLVSEQSTEHENKVKIEALDDYNSGAVSCNLGRVVERKASYDSNLGSLMKKETLNSCNLVNIVKKKTLNGCNLVNIVKKKTLNGCNGNMLKRKTSHSRNSGGMMKTNTKKKSKKPISKMKVNTKYGKLILKNMLNIDGRGASVGKFSDNEDNLSDCSTNTDEILRATGFYLKRNAPKVEKPPPKVKLEEGSLSCPMCDQLFDSYPDSRRHYMTHFTKYLCDLCGNKFTGRVGFLRHMKSHVVTESKYSCNQCQRVYKTTGSLRVHIKVYHRGEMTSKCHQCNMQFKDGWTRIFHMYRVHNVPYKVYECTKCDLKFLQRAKLQNHEDRIHIREPKFACDICSKTFVVKRDLKEHIRYKHGELPQCSFCGRSYSSVKSLRTHEKIHLNIKNFRCQQCDSAFVQGSSLKFHMRKHHPASST